MFLLLIYLIYNLIILSSQEKARSPRDASGGARRAPARRHECAVAAAAPLAAGHARSVKIDEADVVDVRDREGVGAVREAAAGGKACLRRQWM